MPSVRPSISLSLLDVTVLPIFVENHRLLFIIILFLQLRFAFCLSGPNTFLRCLFRDNFNLFACCINIMTLNKPKLW